MCRCDKGHCVFRLIVLLLFFVAMIVKNVNHTLIREMLQVFIFFGIFIDSGNKTKTKFLGRSIVRQWWSLKTCKIKFKKCLQ